MYPLTLIIVVVIAHIHMAEPESRTCSQQLQPTSTPKCCETDNDDGNERPDIKCHALPEGAGLYADDSHHMPP